LLRRGAVGLAAGLVCCLIPLRAADPPGGIHLTVNKDAAPSSVDLAWDTGPYGFSVYRSTEPGNVLDPLNKLGDTTNHTWTDTPPPGSPFFYVVACANGTCALQITYSCDCVGSPATTTKCGNGAVSGAHGEVHTGVSPADVISLYGPDRIGSRATGWACLVEATANICTCVGSAATGSACDNGAILGSLGDTYINVNTATVITSYGPERIGSEATGWACRPTRVDSGPDIVYACYCVETVCDNGAPAGNHHDVVTGVTANNVMGVYGPDRIGTTTTGWDCFPMATNIVACVGTSGLYACDNGAVSGNGGDSVPGVSTLDAISLYGIGRIGSEATGWTATPVSY
jgi:hypothetical protein